MKKRLAHSTLGSTFTLNEIINLKNEIKNERKT